MTQVAQLSTPALLAQLVDVTEAQAACWLNRGLDPLCSTESLARYDLEQETAGVRQKLSVAREVFKRWLSTEMRQKPLSLSDPNGVREYLRLHYGGQEHESFLVLYLDSQLRLIEAETMFRGTLTQASVYPREIIKACLFRNAGAIIAVHNHPSGICEPSRSDELLTKSIKDALAFIEVRLIDHFVVAGDQIVSFAERGLL